MYLSPDRVPEIALAFNDQDGKRKWHQYHFATAPADSSTIGSTIWLGSDKGITDLGDDLRTYKARINGGFYNCVYKLRHLFAGYEIIRSDQGPLSHIPPLWVTWFYYSKVNDLPLLLPPLRDFNKLYDIARVNDHFVGMKQPDCGSYWVGMARFPLPENWVDPRSFWPGWTHLLHTFEFEEAQKAFSFVRDYVSETGGYPQNPKQLTTEIATFLGTDVRKISRRNRNYTYWKFPWTCPLLDRHPLTGEKLA